MTHREETHRGVDVHVTGTEMSGYFGVYQVGDQPQKWAVGDTKDQALKSACIQIDQYFLRNAPTPMNEAKRILEEKAAEAGWTPDTMLTVALQYINNQSDNDCFEDFLDQKIGFEKDASGEALEGD